MWTVELGGFLNAFGNGIVYPFLFIYLHNVRGFSLTVAGLVVSMNALVALFAAPVAGSLIDRVGARRTMIPALLLLAIGFAGFPFVRHPWQALVLAAVVGLGNGSFWPSQHALIATLTPEDRRHAGFSLRRVTENLGFGIGGGVAGLIAATSDPGTFTVLFLLDAATYLVFVGLLAGIREPRLEHDATEPRGYREPLRDRVLLGLLGLNVVFVAAGYAQLETLPVFAKNHAHVSERGIGLVFVVNSVVIVLAQLPVTKLSEGRRRMPTLLLMTVLWAAAWLLVLVAGASLTAVAAAAVIALAAGIFGLGECMQGATQQALVADLAPLRLRGRYMALSSNSWSLGWIAGPAIGAFVLQHAPLALWPGAAGACLAAGFGGLVLERRLPERARRNARGGNERPNTIPEPDEGARASGYNGETVITMRLDDPLSTDAQPAPHQADPAARRRGGSRTS